MPSFKTLFIQNGEISFLGMRNTAMSLLPSDKSVLNNLYEDLKRGKGILDDEAHLNMYLRSYGKMHKAKLDAAFRSLPEIASTFSDEIEIYDWGCGQGIASICLLDYLQSKNIGYKIKSINLIDPSACATKRAEDVISCYDNSITINTVNKAFDDLAVEDFAVNSTKKLHLFSNILDVETFDLAQFTNLFQHLFHGFNLFVCVGPYYSNNKRVDEFIAAVAPDEMYAIRNYDKGMWKNEWTMSLRVFYKNFNVVENITNIRQRIEEYHKKGQFFAGYILDAVSEEYKKDNNEEDIERLFKSLSTFDVKSDKPLDSERYCDSKVAVLANIVSRGLPTKAPLEVENLFSKLFHISSIPKSEEATLTYRSTHKISGVEINSALHIIDPRFDIDFYNGDMLESNFEKSFIEDYLKGTDCQYLIQLLEPQRPLSSIVTIPDRRFSKDQRVDFAIEVPYGGYSTGFVFEIDGAPYHTNIFQKLRDELRDRTALESGWDTYRIDHLTDNAFLSSWEQDTQMNSYLSKIKENSQKTISGSWRDVLQIVLSPLAIARTERMLLQAMLTGVLDISKKEWNLVVVERDVPCAAIAVDLLKKSYEMMSKLDGSNTMLPQIHLSIVSTEEFINSPLHLGYKVLSNIPTAKFDLCIDISMLLRDNIDALPLRVEANTSYIIRSSHYQKNERVILSSKSLDYPPFVQKDSTGKYTAIPERENILTFFLQNIFRKRSFRTGQLPILSHSLSNLTTIGLLPTGGGKSLTYQLSSMLQPGVTIVVDPLVSLMVDQVRGLKDLRIDSCDCVHSGMKGKEKTEKLNLLQNGALQLILLSPERFMMENFRESLSTMKEKNGISFAYGVIDEVHCVSEWGHDFRPAYLHLGRNMINFMETASGHPLPIIGLTATASFDVLADVERELTIGGNMSMDSETIIRPEDDARPELTYRIIETESDFEPYKCEYNPYLLNVRDEWGLRDIVAEAKKRKLYSLIREVPNDIETLNCMDSSNDAPHINNFSAKDFYSANSSSLYDNAGIVFCPHAKGTFGVNNDDKNNHLGISTGLISEFIGALKIGTFVGGNKPSGDMRRFNDNELNLMVATKAFGMGIDKPNVRFTIHINHPSSLEGYVQEAGRGGRDKKHAISYVLYDPTEYIHFTIDKINDLRYEILRTKGYDPKWLESFNHNFVLKSDLISLCKSEGCSDQYAESILEVCKRNNYFENVDKNIDLWFHNNSFRGLYKEQVILKEFTDRILNVKPRFIGTVQERLIEETGITDLLLKVDEGKNAIKIVSKEDRKNQYGYIFLDNLYPTYKFVNFNLEICRNICESLICILGSLEDHSAHALLRPIEDGQDNSSEGIYSAMAKVEADGCVYITVSWENQMNILGGGFEESIKTEISRIAKLEDPTIGKKVWHDIDENNEGKLCLGKVDNFDELLSQISKCSNDSSWLRYHGYTRLYKNLKKIFYQKRDKDDTDKAIYRLCCIGLVEDVTIDYLSQTYELKIRKKTDEQYKQNMMHFFRKYYSLERAEEKVAEIDNRNGRCYLDKCIGYLTAFVYESLEKKRLRAIEDMRIACEDGIAYRESTGNDEWLKQFIHLYFNSKYARKGYKVNGEPYSLSEETDEEGREGFDTVLKYIRIISKDESGTEIDNVKHLYGATLLCLRAHPDNAALLLLLTYCINFLGAGTNETLRRNALNGYIEGFLQLNNKVGDKVWDYIDSFNLLLKGNANNDAFAQDLIKEGKDHIIETLGLIKEGKESVIFLIHEDRFNKFTHNYLK